LISSFAKIQKANRIINDSLYGGFMRWSLFMHILAFSAFSQVPVEMPLWPESQDTNGDASKVPTLTYYSPSGRMATDVAVVVCPGGGYGHLAIEHEGHDVAKWFNSFGVHAFILKYRHGRENRHPIPMNDAKRAMALVRYHAKEWAINPNKIGIMGFSAGGHLASTVGTHSDSGIADAKDPIDRLSNRPDFMILVYPVISFTTEYTHAGSKRNLIGENPDAELVESLSNELQVDADTPPTFLIHASQDKAVPPQNSTLFYNALVKEKVPAELHIYEQGGHGFGLAPNDPVLSGWPERLKTWFKQRGLF
jgi:acetyl esterase/lipase